MESDVVELEPDAHVLEDWERVSSRSLRRSLVLIANVSTKRARSRNDFEAEINCLGAGEMLAISFPTQETIGLTGLIYCDIISYINYPTYTC